ncbi:hypothetical protein SAMN05216428_102361 [Nitrosospira sp. Nsp11]|nr:hypothetical protein SAMN05216428_102361 [Nitrosospira sp. Nsp11]
MQPDNPPSAEEWKIIADHLQLVFRKVDQVKKTDQVSSLVRPSVLEQLVKANERICRERLQQHPLSGVAGQPQCGTSQDTQFGRNQSSVC